MAQRKLPPGVRRWLTLTPALLLCLLAGPWARAATGVDVTVRGVDDEVRDNVLAYLSFERYKKGGADLTPDIVDRLHERVEREVDAALRPFGYYEPQVQSNVTQEDKGTWKVTVDITPGTPVLVDSIDVRVDGPGATDPLFQRILRRLPLRKGQRLNHKSYEDIKNDLQRTAATYGYFDAKLIRNELVVDPPNHKANIALAMATGERYRFGTTTIKQKVIKDSLVRRYLRYQDGEPFDLTQVLRTQFALDDAQYFSNLEVLPGEPDRVAHTVPVNIRADASRRHRYSIGGGYATDTGVRGTVGFEDRRINSSGHTFSVEAQMAQVTKYSLQARYAIPSGDPAVQNFAIRGSIEQRDWGDVTTNTLSVGPAFTTVTGSWQHVWLINAVRTTTSADNDVVAELRPASTDRLLVPELDIASVPKGYLGEPLFERPLFIEIRGSHASLGSNSNFAQVHLQAERAFRVARKWHLLLRGEVGATFASEFSQLPTVYRFFAGGDNSVRGFGYAALSPTEKTTICNSEPPLPQPTLCSTPPGTLDVYSKVGGKDVITGTVELVRELPKSLGVATFFDYGNAFDSWADANKLAYSVGVGIRLRLSVLTLGIDIAKPLYEPCAQPIEVGRSGCTPGGLRLHINFSPKL
ncbi:MAG TPA: POTRA domain-containing protein [Steroidobacteraceae bacterium]